MAYLMNPFEGSMSRGDWWFSQLAIIVLVVLGMVCTFTFASDHALPAGEKTGSEGWLLVLLIVGAVYMNFATCLNRLRDTGRSGMWYLAFLLPTVGTGIMIYFCGIEAGSD